jgi:hypothetical protein
MPAAKVVTSRKLASGKADRKRKLQKERPRLSDFQGLSEGMPCIQLMFPTPFSYAFLEFFLGWNLEATKYFRVHLLFFGGLRGMMAFTFP